MISKDERNLRRICRNYEQVENYEKAIADKENKWHLHHRREIDENKSMQLLKEEGVYYDVEPEELIFLLHSEHIRIHKIHNGRHSEETRKKMSDAHKGKMHSEETRKKMSENHADVSGEKNYNFGKHHTADTKKKMSEALKGRTFSEETRKKLSEALRGENSPLYKTFWWNNGTISKRSKEKPGPDFEKGMLKLNKSPRKSFK